MWAPHLFFFPFSFSSLLILFLGSSRWGRRSPPAVATAEEAPAAAAKEDITAPRHAGGRGEEETGEAVAAKSQPHVSGSSTPPPATDDVSDDAPSTSVPAARGPQRTPWQGRQHRGQGSMGAATVAAGRGC